MTLAFSLALSALLCLFVFVLFSYLEGSDGREVYGTYAFYCLFLGMGLLIWDVIKLWTLIS